MRWIVLLLGVTFFVTFFMWPVQVGLADPIKRAKKAFLQGQRYYRAKKYRKARAALEKAYRAVPLHPHFRCVRARMLNLLGKAQSRTGRPYAAMRSHRKASRICGKRSIRRLAKRRYRYLFRRWMCMLKIKSKPSDAWVFMDYKKVGRTPWKKVMRPGKHRFRIRRTDYKSVRFKLRLRPGQRIVKKVKLERGDDPLHRPERPKVAPPPVYRP